MTSQFMTRLEGRVSELLHCLPGDRLAVWYSDDTMYHERILVWRTKTEPGTWFVLTPDYDLYQESFDDPSEGPHHFKIKGVHFKFYSRLPSPIYRFSEEVTEEEMKGYIETALDDLGVASLGPADWYPSNAKIGGKLVSVSKLLGRRAVPRRIGKGAGRVEQPAPEANLASPISPLVADQLIPITKAPEEHLWLHLPAQKAGAVAREVQVEDGKGVMTRNGYALYNDKEGMIPLTLVKVEEAPAILGAYRDDVNPVALMQELGVEKPHYPVGESLEKLDGEVEVENPDARVLEVDYDTQGERYKEWRQVALECKEYTFQDWPLEGPLSTGHLVKHFSKFGGDPKRWLADWMRSKQIQENDRISFEMKVLIESIYLAGTYDQLNLGCLASVEILARRIQAVVDAYSAGPIPDWGAAKVMTLYRSPEDAISPQLRSWAARKNKEEMELAQSRAKLRDSRKGLVVEEASASAVADGVLPGAVKPKAKSKGRGRGLEAPANQ